MKFENCHFGTPYVLVEAANGHQQLRTPKGEMKDAPLPMKWTC